MPQTHTTPKIPTTERERRALAVVREDSERFIELANFLYPLDCRLAVAGLMRSTPRGADDVLNMRRPVPPMAMERAQALYDELERLECDVDMFLCDQGPHVLHMKAAGSGGGQIKVERVPQPPIRAAWPFNRLMPGDWFYVPGRMGGMRSIAIACQRKNAEAGTRLYAWQHLRGGTRVDRLP